MSLATMVLGCVLNQTPVLVNSESYFQKEYAMFLTTFEPLEPNSTGYSFCQVAAEGPGAEIFPLCAS